MLKDLPKTKEDKSSILKTDIPSYMSMCSLLGYELNTEKYITGRPLVDKKDNLSLSYYHVDYTDEPFRKIQVYTKEGVEKTVSLSNRLNKKRVRQHLLSYIRNNEYHKRLFNYKDATKKDKHLAYCMTKTYGAFRKKYTRCIGFDIDNHDEDQEKTDEVLKSLYDYFGEFPLFIEEGTSGGFHVFYAFKDFITMSQAKQFIKAFNHEYNTDIEILTDTKAFRLPESFSYYSGELIGFTETGTPLIVPFGNINEASDYVLDNIHNKKLDTSLVTDLSHFNIELDDIIDEDEHDYSNLFYRTDTQGNMVKKSGIKNIYTDFPITEGNRVSGEKQLFKLANYCIYLGKDFETFLEATHANNKSSKNLTYDSNEKIERDCRYIYDYCNKNFKSIKSTSSSLPEFKSNKHLLTEEIKDFIDKYHDQLMKFHGIKKTKSKYNYRYHLASKLLIQEMMGKIIYEAKNPRKIREDAFLTKEKKEQLQIGFVFPKEFLYSFCIHYDLKNIDIFSMLNFILKKGNLFKQYFHNLSGYSFGKIGFCRQWIFEYISLHRIEQEIVENLEASIFYMKKSLRIIRGVNGIPIKRVLKSFKDSILEVLRDRSTIDYYKELYYYGRYSLPDSNLDHRLRESFLRV